MWSHENSWLHSLFYVKAAESEVLKRACPGWPAYRKAENVKKFWNAIAATGAAALMMTACTAGPGAGSAGHTPSEAAASGSAQASGSGVEDGVFTVSIEEAYAP